MAEKYTDRDLRQITETTKVAFDILYGNPIGYYGYESEYKKGRISKEKYDAAVKQYKDAQEEKNKISAFFKKQNAVEQTKKDKSNAQQTYDKAIETLRLAELTIPSGGQDKADEAYAAAIEAKAVADSLGIKTKPIPVASLGVKRTEVTSTGSENGEAGTDTGTPNDKFAGYVLNANGSVTGPAADGKTAGLTSYLVNKTNPNGDVQPVFYTSLVQARNAFLEKYTQPGQIDALKKQLLASRYINDKTINTDDWVFGIDKFINEYTRQTVSAVQYGGVTKPALESDFMKIKMSGTDTGSGSSGRYQVNTTRSDAKEYIDRFLMDLTGVGATPEQEEAFFKELDAKENKAVSITKDGVTTGSVLTDADRLLIAAKVGRKALVGTNIDTLLSANKGSSAAINIAQLQATAADYGIPMSATEALKYVAAGLGQDDFLNKQEERIKLLSKQMYKNLDKYISDGGKVKDLADQYAEVKSIKFGKPVRSSIQDADVMAAIQNDVSLQDFNRGLNKKPEWRFTDEANNMADNFTEKFLKSFGLSG